MLTLMQFLPQLLRVLLQDGFLGVQNSHVHLQVSPTRFLSFQIMIQLLNLKQNAVLGNENQLHFLLQICW